MVVDLPQADLATPRRLGARRRPQLRADVAEDQPIAYLGAGASAAAGWAASVGGDLNAVMAWNGRPTQAWAHLPSVRVPSLLVVDETAPWLRVPARLAHWRLGARSDLFTGVAPDDLGILGSWYHDRLLVPTTAPEARPQPARPARRMASVGVAAVLGVTPAGVLSSTVVSTVAARPALAAGLPDFSAGNRLGASEIFGDNQTNKWGPSVSEATGEGMRLSAADIDGDTKNTGPIGDPPLVDGIGVRWNINTNVGFTTSSSASGAVSEAGFTHVVAATTLNGGTVNQALGDAFDGYNALCIDLNNVGGQCNTANMAVYNQNGPASLECSGRQVVLPLRTMGSFRSGGRCSSPPTRASPGG